MMEKDNPLYIMTRMRELENNYFIQPGWKLDVKECAYRARKTTFFDECPDAAEARPYALIKEYMDLEDELDRVVFGKGIIDGS